MEEDAIRKKVRKGYAKIATQGTCCSTTTPCCDTDEPNGETSRKMGYSREDLEALPEGANLGLGCGNPVALASLKEGETVIDLGAGGGIDCFLAAKRVGDKGKVIGVDMTPEMIDKARKNARKGDYRNVEFRLGEIENLPVADNTADVIISNCVINLAPNKKRVFEEAFRVLKPGGRLMVSDIVLLKELPESVRKRGHPAGCVTGAMLKDKYLAAIAQAGFKDVRTIKETRQSFEEIVNDPEAKVMVAKHEEACPEPRPVSQLSEKEKGIMKQILTSTMSVDVSAVKP